jgi:STE24 endopeptidase
LWWSRFPADRALREQSLLTYLENDLPVHSAPKFWDYFRSNVRLQVLFTLVPVALILGVRDMATFALWKVHPTAGATATIDAIVSLGSAMLVLLLAPEILRRVLHTQPLPPSPLRDRLEALCKRSKLRYREILLWHTENNMGNAAVMGLIPRVRYILLSDLLLESMRDEQIEAVFAHEVGHIVHRHMGWYVVFFVILMLAGVGASTTFGHHLDFVQLPSWLPPELIVTAISVGAFLLTFGFLSRRFERQADVYAARTIQMAGQQNLAQVVEARFEAARPIAYESRTHVGPYGATVFASALHRVAVINNIPVAARSWCHGSIAKRMKYLEDLSADPSHTTRFDRFMGKLYVALVLALVVCGAWAVVAR